MTEGDRKHYGYRASMLDFFYQTSDAGFCSCVGMDSLLRLRKNPGEPQFVTAGTGIGSRLWVSHGNAVSGLKFLIQPLIAPLN
jgi:hypothetical protein